MVPIREELAVRLTQDRAARGTGGRPDAWVQRGFVVGS